MFSASVMVLNIIFVPIFGSFLPEKKPEVVSCIKMYPNCRGGAVKRKISFKLI